jgi:hypothetical protein
MEILGSANMSAVNGGFAAAGRTVSALMREHRPKENAATRDKA